MRIHLYPCQCTHNSLAHGKNGSRNSTICRTPGCECLGLDIGRPDLLPPGPGTVNRRRIVDHLRRNDGRSYDELERELGLSPKAVRLQLAILFRNGMVGRFVHGKSWYWYALGKIRGQDERAREATLRRLLRQHPLVPILEQNPGGLTRAALQATLGMDRRGVFRLLKGALDRGLVKPCLDYGSECLSYQRDVRYRLARIAHAHESTNAPGFDMTNLS